MYPVIKRIADILVSGLAILLLLPVFIPVMLILLCTGEHEVFYFQKRIGYKNKPFYIWKLATMLKNSPNMGTGEITLRKDPRVTPFGRFLRKTKMNELPQLVNVLKGDMSLVGPRPLMEISYLLYSEEVRGKIYQNRPGLTGIGSLVFRDEEKILSAAPDPRAMYQAIYPYKGELEMWYLQHQSITTDLTIIILTAWSVLFPDQNLAGRFFKNLPIRPHWS